MYNAHYKIRDTVLQSFSALASSTMPSATDSYYNYAQSLRVDRGRLHRDIANILIEGNHAIERRWLKNA